LEQVGSTLARAQVSGQLVGEVLKHLGEEKFIVKSASGPRSVVGCRMKVRFDQGGSGLL
jgi:26S proteasome regulatory subunit T4